jgi:hypothetical protein
MPNTPERHVVWALALMSLALAAGSCARGPAGPAGTGSLGPATLPTQPADVAVAPPTAPVTFDSPANGVSLTYAPDWQPKADADYLLRLVPPTGPADRFITLDVPSLPPHLPGWIPLGLVENGYVDDLKNEHPGLKVAESTAPTIPGAKARCVRTTWTTDGSARTDLALLIVHGDRVYILRAQGPAEEAATLAATLEELTRSIKWKG